MNFLSNSLLKNIFECVKETCPWYIAASNPKHMFRRYKQLIILIFGGLYFLCLLPYNWNY